MGLKTVGGWAGTDIAKNEFNEKMVDKWIPPFESYKLLSPPAIMQVLKKSHINKPNYLFSLATNMTSIQAHAKKYDSYTTEIMSQAFTLPEIAENLNSDIDNAIIFIMTQ
jgi:hypothetical protein